MANKILKGLIRFSPILIITLIWAVIVANNYSPNTWLTGWDNLHPEFNFWLNIKRTIFSSWQEYQGLGLLGGMAHAADLPRQLILWASSLIFPSHLIRYVWTFGMLLIGPVGVYSLLQKRITKLAALGGALFYLLNLATVQYFFTPYESFVSFYGFLPWLLFSAIDYLKSKDNKKLIVYFFVSLMTTPAFYVQTLFLVYLIILGAILFEKPNIKILIATFIANSFWLLPVIYFMLTNVDVVGASKINSIASPETRLMNQSFGDLLNTLLLRNFWFEYIDVHEGKFVYLMNNWREYLSLIYPMAIGIFLGLVGVFGIAINAVNKNRILRFSPVILLGFIFAIMYRGGILIENLPVIGEAFRSVFTKWSIPLALLFSFGIGSVVNILPKFIKHIASLILIILMIILVRPVFNGELISSDLKQNIPQEYFELFDYFEDQPKESRIAFYPVQSHWGWNFYESGYRGSGFLWYGIEQPILDRAFDVWSVDNESFYNEFSNAIYQNNRELTKKVLEKYDIDYVLIDESVILPENKTDILKFDQTQNLLKDINFDQVFEQNFISVYKSSTSNESFVDVLSDYTVISGEVNKSRFDQIYSKLGNYIYDNSGTNYLFSDIYAEFQNGLEFSKELELSADSNLNIPAFEENATYELPAVISFNGKRVTLNISDPYEIKLDGKLVNVENRIPELYVDLPNSYENVAVEWAGNIYRLSTGETKQAAVRFGINDALSISVFDIDSRIDTFSESKFARGEVNTCWEREGGEALVESSIDSGAMSIKVRDAVGCASYKLGDFYDNDYLLNFTLPYKSDSFARPHFCIVEEGTDKCLNNEVFYQTPSSGVWTGVTRDVIMEKGKSYWVIVAARPPAELGIEWEISYKTPSAIASPLVARLEFSADVWDNLKQPHTVFVPVNTKQIRVTLAAVEKNIDLVRSGRGEAYNCDVFERGVAQKSVSDIVVYTAGNYGSSCDYFVAPNVNTNQEYLLRLVGSNESGRGLKFYLTNQEQARTDLEYLLDSQTFDQTFALLSWGYSGEYVLNVEARSFGVDVGKSTLEKAAFYPAPLSWLGSLNISSEEHAAQNINPQILSESKISTYFYKVIIRSESDTYLTLTQSYGSGWVAYSPTLGFLPHTKLNSWANAWEVSSGEHTVYIFYWPQLLQIISYFVILLVSLCLLKKSDTITRFAP